MEFKGFPKIARLSRNCVVTEKIDGTNAQIFWDEVVAGSEDDYESQRGVPLLYTYIDGIKAALWVGSRTRWITPENDNFGFAKWAVDNYDQLTNLGFGQHFGEWWGTGIQRKYGLDYKRFSLFNTNRWGPDRDKEKYPEAEPACCGVVPVLYKGPFDTEAIEGALKLLEVTGSWAAPGFMNPEGIVIYHEASKALFKKTIEKDEEPKGR